MNDIKEPSCLVSFENEEEIPKLLFLLDHYKLLWESGHNIFDFSFGKFFIENKGICIRKGRISIRNLYNDFYIDSEKYEIKTAQQIFNTY